MILFLFKIYINIRKITSPIFYWILRFTIHRGKLPNIWNDAKKLNKSEFSNLINSYPYKSDFFRGIIDNTLRQPDFFFVSDRNSDRDCDDFAQMWYWWADYNNYETYMVAISNGIFKEGHMLTIIKKDGCYKLADYIIRGNFNSIDEIKKYIIKYDNYDKLLWYVVKMNF